MSTEEQAKKYNSIAVAVAVVLLVVIGASIYLLDAPEKSKRKKGYDRKMKVNPGDGGFNLRSPDFLRLIELPTDYL